MQNALIGILDDLKERGGLRAADVANITGKSPATVSRWTRGTASPHPKTQVMISDLRYIVDRLAELYTPEEARLWLFAVNPLLFDRRPIELILDRKTDKVVSVIDDLVSGSYL